MDSRHLISSGIPNFGPVLMREGLLLRASSISNANSRSAGSGAEQSQNPSSIVISKKNLRLAIVLSTENGSNFFPNGMTTVYL